jgi:hypothetical protein
MDQTGTPMETLAWVSKKESPMPFRDILLTLTSYPDPTPVSVVEEAVSIAASLGAHLAAVACEVHVEVPGHFLSGSIANVPGIIAGETEKSRKSAKDMLAAFDAAADKAGVLHETYLEKCPTFAVPDLLVDYARLRDLTIVPVPEGYDQWYAEAVIFGSGRPTLVLPESPRPRPFELGTVAIAWGFQPRGGAGGFRCDAAARKGEQGTHRHRHQRKEAGYQAFLRRAGKEPRAPRYRRRAGQGRCERPTYRRSS